ncbi:hypothetical protein Tco_1132165 [Tanacetum coccineum]|uniref:Retrovirus-related Pol polyprotein from transposon TNT 1-94-like beta-barrel domain-containing protein n=1 Tax=Tanacetum coccineum TaxID=301880 RepID=A0ABQ5JBQ9_9ASTR
MTCTRYILGNRYWSMLYGQDVLKPVCMMLELLHPNHHPVSIWDSEEVLVHQVVSMKKMNEKPGHVRPANDFYAKLNALMFVPQKDLSGDQAYWLSANEIASQASKSATPATPFVHKSRPPSQVLASLQKVNAVFPQFEGIIKERTTQKPDYVSEWCYDYAKQFVEQQLVPFYDHFKKHIQAANDTFFKEVKEYEQIFDELEAEYEQCVLDNKNLTIEKKNLLIRNDGLIADCLEKDICSIVLTSDIVVPPSSNCLCEDLRSACDREHTKVLELEAEISKQKQLFIESEKRFAFLEQQLLKGKKTRIDFRCSSSIMKVLIVLDGLKVENVSLKRRYDELSKANTHSRTAYTEKLSALTTQHTKLQAQVTGTTSSGPSTSETPKVLAPGRLQLRVVQIVLWYLDSGCSRHMTGDRARLINFVEKFIGTVRFGNDEYAAIVGYGDYKLGDTIISRVYYVEGLCTIIFFSRKVWDGGSRTTNLYSISLNDMMSASPVCLLTKASSTSHGYGSSLNHMNFGLGKSKKASHPLKDGKTPLLESYPTLHMVLAGPYEKTEMYQRKETALSKDGTTLIGSGSYYAHLCESSTVLCAEAITLRVFS